MARVLVWLFICLAACGCRTQRLRCDGPLQPINAPAQEGKPSATAADREGSSP
jgi:hypothetical protein